MSFIAILLALLIEQARPLARGNSVHAAMRRWVRWVSRNIDAGGAHHAGLAWAVAVLLPSVVTTGLHWLLWWSLGWAAATFWSVLVLYAALGFRQFSHHFTAIRDALQAGDESTARRLLANWQQLDANDLPRSEIVRHVIEFSVLAAHRHVFGVLIWFSVLAAFGLGPGGAVLFRMSEFVARYWREQGRIHNRPVSDALQRMARAAWHWIDWLPSRITALGFAVVGSFEDAIDGWRNHVGRYGEDNDGVLLAATAGALNVALGADAAIRSRLRAGSALGAGFTATASESAAGSETDLGALNLPDSEVQSLPESGESPVRPAAELAHLRSVVGLVWRSVVMWMVLLALLTLSRLLG